MAQADLPKVSSPSEAAARMRVADAAQATLLHTHTELHNKEQRVHMALERLQSLHA